MSKKPTKKSERKKISSNLREKIKARIRENAKQGFPKTTVELAEEFTDKNVTPATIQNFETRMKDMPKRGSRHKAKWKPTPGGPQKYDEINDFIIGHPTLRDAELARLCNLKLNALEKRKAVLRAQGKISVSAKFAGGRNDMAAADGQLIKIDKWLQEELTTLLSGTSVPADMNALIKTLAQKLPEELREKSSEITRLVVYEALDTLCWGTERRKMVLDANKAKISPEELHDLLVSYGHELTPPLWLVKDKMEEVRGRTHAPRAAPDFSLRGILRAPIAEGTATLPRSTSFKMPLHALPENTAERISFAFISAPQVGLPYHLDIKDNLTRCAFSTARKQNCDAIVIGGGLFRMVLQKTVGPNRILYDLIARDQEIDPESVARHYRQEMMEIRKKNKKGEYLALFITAAERLSELLRGWRKNTLRPLNEGPEFNGPVYIILSDDDLALARKLAYFELAFDQKKRWSEAVAKRGLLAKLKEESYNTWLQVSHSYDEEIVADVQARCNDWLKNRDLINDVKVGEITAKEIQETINAMRLNEGAQMVFRAYIALCEAERKLNEAIELENRTKMSNLDSAQNTLVYDQAVRYLITKIEERIPNARVIEQNYAFIRFGAQEEIVKIICRKPPGQPYYREIENIGPTQRAGELPNLTIVANPAALYYREGARENYLGGKTYGTVRFVEAPILVDAEAIREHVGGYKINVPSINAAIDPMFQAGMLIITIDKTKGVDLIPFKAQAIRHQGRTRSQKKKPDELLWMAAPTDWHIGSPHRVMIPRHDGLPTYPTEAFFELIRRSGMDEDGAAHFGSLIVMDDIFDGSHHENHKEIQRRTIPFGTITNEVTKELERLKKIKSKEAVERYQTLVRHLMTQIAIRTPYHMTGQYREFVTSVLNPYKDVLRGILLRAKKSGVIVRGVGELTHGGPDSCDIGVETFASGNHTRKTTDGTDHEGPHVAELIRQRLADDPAIVSAGIDVNRWITSPLFGSQSIGYGRLSFGGGVEYGIHLASTPPKRDSWVDTTHGFVQANRRVGNPSGILDKVVAILHLAGDKHIPSVNNAGGDFYLLGSANTHTESFAYMAGGLPENPPGIWLIGIPKDGPNVTPIRTVFLTISLLREYLNHPTRAFPWNDVCPYRF